MDGVALIIGVVAIGAFVVGLLTQRGRRPRVIVVQVEEEERGGGAGCLGTALLILLALAVAGAIVPA